MKLLYESIKKALQWAAGWFSLLFSIFSPFCEYFYRVQRFLKTHAYNQTRKLPFKTLHRIGGVSVHATLGNFSNPANVRSCMQHNWHSFSTFVAQEKV